MALHYTPRTPLHYTLLQSTTLHSPTLHKPNYTNHNHNYNCNHNYSCTTLHYNHSYSDNCNCANYFRLHYTRLHYTTLFYITLHSLHCKNNRNYTTLIILHYTQLQLHYATTTTTTTAALHYMTSSSCGLGDNCNHCNHSKNTTPTTFRSPSGFALPSMIHNNQPLLQVSYSETSATALFGTTGNFCFHSCVTSYILGIARAAMLFLESILAFPTWHSIPAFYLASILTFYSVILSGIHSGIFARIYSGIHSGTLAVILSGMHFHILSDMGIAWPQPQVPTEIWRSRLRYVEVGSAHCDLELALEEGQGGRGGREEGEGESNSHKI